MSAYFPPSQSTPIFNTEFYKSNDDSLTQSEANSLYVQTGSANQSIAGNKSFSSITNFNTTNGSLGGQAITVKSLFPPHETRLYSVNSSFSTDLYFPESNGITTLVSVGASQTLINKIINPLQIGSSNSNPINEFRSGVFTVGAINAGSSQAFALTFSPAFPSGTTPIVQLNVNSTSAISSFQNFLICSVYSITNTGCSIQVLNCNTAGGNVSVNTRIAWSAFTFT